MGFVMYGEPAGQASIVHSLEQMTNDERVESVVCEMKKVAFVCVHNSCRSQIAEALGRRFAGDAFESHSAGTETKPRIDWDAVRLMREIYGIDMEAEGQRSKPVRDIPGSDVAISMGCNVGCPFVGRPFDDDWGLEDPTGKSDEEFRKVIAEIESRVKALADIERGLV